jgi:catechol 2,3-dioxygenase-like lactoylglutathione lyase family enzyme
MFDVWHLGLPVRGLEESVGFYVDGLGFELLGYHETERYRVAFARVPAGAFTLEFLEFRDPKDRAAARKPDHLAFEAADLDGLHARLRGGGFFAALPEIADASDGLRKFALTDPDGVPVQFHQGRAAFDRSIASTARASRPAALKSPKEEHHVHQ